VFVRALCCFCYVCLCCCVLWWCAYSFFRVFCHLDRRLCVSRSTCSAPFSVCDCVLVVMFFVVFFVVVYLVVMMVVCDLFMLMMMGMSGEDREQ